MAKAVRLSVNAQDGALLSMLAKRDVDRFQSPISCAKESKGFAWGGFVAGLTAITRNIWLGPLLAAGRLWTVGAPFETNDVEGEFRNWRARLSAPQRRAGLYFGLVAWTAAVDFDLFSGASRPVSHGVLPAVLAMRGGGVLALIGAIAASSLHRFETFTFAEAVIWVLSTALQLLLITMATTQEKKYGAGNIRHEVER